jgi:hypothetical protein
MVWSPDDESVDEGECKSDGVGGLSFDETVTFDECTPFTSLGANHFKTVRRILPDTHDW